MTHDTFIFYLHVRFKYAKRPPQSGYVQVALVAFWEITWAECSVSQKAVWTVIFLVRFAD